jgi:hypothetical protein
MWPFLFAFVGLVINVIVVGWIIWRDIQDKLNDENYL